MARTIRTGSGPDAPVAEEHQPLLETVLRTVADGITVLDPSGRLVYANEAAARALGYDSLDELLATPVAEIMTKFDLMDETGAPFPPERLPGRLALNGEHPEPTLLRFRIRATGEERWSIVNATPVLDGSGTVRYATYAFHDVTARMRAEETQRFLVEASDLLNSSLDYKTTLASLARLLVPRLGDWCIVDVAADDGSIEQLAVAHVDPEKVRLAVELRRRWPPGPDDVTGVAAVLREGSSQLFSTVSDELLAAAARDDEHLRAARELGLRSAMLVPLVARGRVLGVISLVSAESGRHYRENDLALLEDVARRAAVAVDNARLFQEAEERAAAARVLSHVADGVFLVDEEGVVRLWNRAAEAITGLGADTVVGRRLEDVLPGWRAVGGLVPVVASPEEVPPRQEAVPLEIGGREVWLSLTGVGFAEGTVYAVRDMTEERRIEELKTDFLATASHELRTPLAAVYGAAATLRRDDLELDAASEGQLLAIIANESDRLTRIVDDILWAGRVESGRLSLSIERCDAAELAAGVLEAARAHVPGTVRLELATPPELPAVAADADKVRQVLANLVDNAVKYSPDGGVVEVRLEAHEGRLVCSVRDEGLGIPGSEQTRIFEKFYRLDPNLTRGVGGTGLGLYISRELVRRMGGRIWVASREGGGSTFFFELPLAR